MKFETIDFSHKDLIVKSLSGIETNISEYSFANLYLFRKYHDYKFGIVDNVPLVFGKSYDNQKFYMILECLKYSDKDFIKKLLCDVDYIFPIDKKWKDFFDLEVFYFDYYDGDSDYIYTVEKMSTYKGRKLHKKRNLLKQHNLNFSTEAFCIDDLNINDAEYILEQWMKDVDMEIDETDYYACKEALEKRKELGLCGVIYYSDNEPSGFILGEGLNNETFVMHFAKGLRYYKGIYQYMYNNFAKKLPRHYKYINFEQDLGKVALKVAKSSYVPDYMLKKYRLKLLQ